MYILMKNEYLLISKKQAYQITFTRAKGTQYRDRPERHE